jgi:hypothetical protein
MTIKSVRIQVNSAGVRAVLSSDGVLADVASRGDRIAEAAGGSPDFESNARVVEGSSKLGRAMAYVRTASQRRTSRRRTSPS